MMTNIKLFQKIQKILLIFIYNLIVVFILLEIIFQFLPVSDSLKLMPVNKQQPIAHYKPDREVNLQIGANFNIVNKKKINNFGYLTDKNFTKDQHRNKKLVAVIGDSFVVAKEVSNQNTFHGIIQKNRNELDLYPFAVSGAPLSQYLAFKDYALKNFNPDIFVFIIISNDFNESWKKVNNSQGFHYFKNDGTLELQDYKPSLLKILLRNSSFVRYLILDLKIHLRLNNLTKPEKEHYEIKKNLSIRAVEIFLDKINNLSSFKDVIIILDGDRDSIYNNNYERNYKKMHNYAMRKIKIDLNDHKKIKIVDMHPIFLEDWINNKKKFNFKNDFHWNEYGHNIVSKNLNSTLEKILYD